MAGKESNRSGVALIIVLGLVAILMIISVAFAIHMRVERAGSANLRHAAVARQIVKGGIAAAIAAIDKDVGDEIVAPWYDENNVESLIYKRREKWYDDGITEDRTTNFWKGTLVSYDPNSRLEHVTAHFPAEVDDYLPYGLKYRSFANRYIVSNSEKHPIIQPEWLPVYSDIGNDSVIGRYAYFVLDTTGMLDANAGYGTETRDLGYDTKEIQPVSAVAKIPKDKTGAYVNIAELEKVNPNLKGWSNIWWNTFSYEPTNGLVYIGGDADDIRSRREEIIAAFYDLGLTGGKKFRDKDCEQARWAYLGLVDYVDDDNKMEEDPNIAPCERPATERMPLVSGFFAQLSIEARQKQKKQEGESDFSTTEPVQVKISAKVKVPFVFPFLPDDLEAKDAEGLVLEGKAALRVVARGGNDLKMEKQRVSPQDREECIVQTISINDGNDDGWVALRRDGENRTVAQQLELQNVFVSLQVAGATLRNGKIQHSFPIGESNYNTFSKDDEYMGMFVDFDPVSEGVKFNEGDAQYGPESAADANHIVQRERKWATNVLVWAEIVDPRFACLALRDAHGDSSDGLLRCCIKGSHAIDSDGDGKDDNGDGTDQSVTLLKLRQKVPEAFKGFNDPENFRRTFLSDYGKANNSACGPWGATAYSYGTYFDGNPFAGANPFTSYLLTNPNAVEKYYGMPMDGIQKGSSSDETDPAFAKWVMYVKNSRLESVGELGYLPIGFWQTIRLYDYGDNFGKHLNAVHIPSSLYKFNELPEDLPRDAQNPSPRLYPDLHKEEHDNGVDDHEGGFFHNVLECFTVTEEHSAKANEIIKGRINLNASSRDLLASAFNGLPLQEPNGFFGRALTETNAYLMASAVIRSRNNLGNFCGLSELGYLFEEPVAGPLYRKRNESDTGLSYVIQSIKNNINGATWGEFARESIIRNSCGLFTTRGQSFLIVVRGESYSPRFGHRKSLIGGNSNASKTAIAQIWRDTIPDANGQHPVFVKFFKIIDD